MDDQFSPLFKDYIQGVVLDERNDVLFEKFVGMFDFERIKNVNAHRKLRG